MFPAPLAQTDYVAEFFVCDGSRKMFVQKFSAARDRPRSSLPVVMVHGGMHTGSCFVSTPDGRPGFAPLFARAGWDTFVVDWPGMGRSGFTWPESLHTSALDVRDCVVALLRRIGPAILLGHSIGGAIALKVAERASDHLAAVVALAPASMERFNPHVPPAEPGTQTSLTREEARARFANAPRFPHEAFDIYYETLTPSPAVIRNAAVGLTDDLKLDRGQLALWKRLPVLFLAGDSDRTVLPSQSQITADLMGVPQILLGADWGLEGFGHLIPIEQGNDLIASKIQDWLHAQIDRRGRDGL